MLRIELVVNATTYRFANQPTDYASYYWEPRIVNDFDIERFFEVSDKVGSRKRSINLTLSNRDKFFNSIHDTYSLLNKQVSMYYSDGGNNTKKFIGIITEINSFGTEVEVTVSEELSLYLRQPIPDAQVAYDYYSDKGINESWNAIPIIIGNVSRLKVQWVDKVAWRFMIGSGPLASIDKVYFDKVIMYDKSRPAAENFYRIKDGDPKIKVRIYRGTSWAGSDFPELVNGITTVYPGFSYLEFYDENTGLNVAPMLSDGTIPEIYVDVKGIAKLTDSTQPERNPAKVLYQLAINPITTQNDTVFAGGLGGFGLGIPVDKIDFTEAINYCETNSIYIDGVIAQKAEASEWFDELSKYAMSTFIEEGGVYKLLLDKAATSVEAHFDDTGETGYNVIVGNFEEPAYDKQINRVKLYYDLDAETGKFNRKPYGSQESPIPENSGFLQDSVHAVKIGKWNTETYEYKYVKDDRTAHIIAQYNFKRNLLQLKTVTLDVESTVPASLDVRSLITVTSSKHGWTSKQFRIISITKGETGIRIKAREYDANVYTSSFIPGSAIVRPLYSSYAIPEKPILLTLTSTSELQTDGSTKILINATFTKPASNCDRIALYYKSDGSPETDFRLLDYTQSDVLKAQWPVGAGNYNFRAISISPFGCESSLQIVTGDKHYYGHNIGGGAETYLTVQGDAVAPGTPIISNVTPVISGVVFSLAITGGTPSDFDHFEIERQIGAGSAVLINGNVRTTLYSDIDSVNLSSGATVYYRAKAVDKSGNASAWTSWTAGVQSLYIETKDITANQIIAKDFRTACNVGIGNAAGVMFNQYGIQAYNGSEKTFCLESNGNLWLKGIICATSGTFSGTVCATSGDIGGWTIANNCLYATTTGTIRTSATAGLGGNGVVLDSTGIRGYDSVLGTVFNIPVDGSKPCFSSGIIQSTCFEINTNSILRTSVNALNYEAGVLINNSGIYASDASTTGSANAKVKLTVGGGLYLGSNGSALSWDGTMLRIGCNYQTGNSLVNNFSVSGNTNGWNAWYGGLSIGTKDGVSVCVYCIQTTADIQIVSDYIEVDPNSTYRFSMAVCSTGVSSGNRYVGLHAFDKDKNMIGMTSVNPQTGTDIANGDMNPYWSIIGGNFDWLQIEGNVYPQSTPAQDISPGCNITCQWKMPPNTRYLAIRFLNFYNSGNSHTDYFFAPTIHKVDRTTKANSIYRGLDNLGTLQSRVIPTCTASPSASGLYMGSDYLGYYQNGVGWKSYMSNTGNFYLSGATGGLGWDGTTLTVCGTICSCCGCFAGWSIQNNVMSSGKMWISANPGSENIGIYRDDSGRDYLTIGKSLYTGTDAGWVNETGIAYTDENQNSIFELSSRKRQISCWNFKKGQLWTGYCIPGGIAEVELLAGDSGIGVPRYGMQIFTCNTSTGAAMSISMGKCLHHPGVAWCAMDGIMIADSSSGVLFKVGKYHSDCSSVAEIAGWRFSNTGFYSGGLGTSTYATMNTNLFSCGLAGIMVSNWYKTIQLGQTYWGYGIRNIYGLHIGTFNQPTDTHIIAGFGIGAETLPNGTAVSNGCPLFFVGKSTEYLQYFNNELTLKGTICSTKGRIACWCLDTNRLFNETNGLDSSYSLCSEIYASESDKSKWYFAVRCYLNSDPSNCDASFNAGVYIGCSFLNTYIRRSSCWHGFQVTANPSDLSSNLVVACGRSDNSNLAMFTNYATTGVSTAIRGCSYCNLAIVGWATGCQAVYGCANLCMAIHGSAGSCMGVYGFATTRYGGYFQSAEYGLLACSTGYNGMVAYATSGCAGVFCSPWPSIYVNNGLYSATCVVAASCMCASVYCTYSSKSLKKCIVDPGSILLAVVELPVKYYQFCNDECCNWHMGTFAEEFQSAFPYIGDGKGLPSLDGILLKSIQEIYTITREEKQLMEDRLTSLETRILELENKGV